MSSRRYWASHRSWSAAAGHDGGPRASAACRVPRRAVDSYIVPVLVAARRTVTPPALQFRWDVPAVHEHAEGAVALATEQGFPQWVAWGRSLRGWALAKQGQGEAGMALVCQGIAAWRTT